METNCTHNFTKLTLTTNSATTFATYDPALRDYQRSQFIKKKKKKKKKKSTSHDWGADWIDFANTACWSQITTLSVE